jgi:hypothetical protein
MEFFSVPYFRVPSLWSPNPYQWKNGGRKNVIMRPQLSTPTQVRKRNAIDDLDAQQGVGARRQLLKAANGPVL